MSDPTSVPADSADAEPGDALTRLTALLADDMAVLNQEILDRMHSEVALIPTLASYIVASGGKRVRPALTIAAARLCGYEGDRHARLAAVVEFIHTATLLHDDVVDESVLRRGQTSANEVFGNKPSVLVGDFLFSRAFELMTEDGSLDVLRTLSRASAVIAEGEVLQLAAQNDLKTDEALYLKVIDGKTAALFAAAASVGGITAGADGDRLAALDTYGRSLGMAFQLVDDVLDYSASQARLGKTVGDDFREGKVTLPIILAHADGDAAERAFWTRTLEAQEIEEGDLDQAMTLLGRHRALDRTIERARAHGDQALAALQAFAPHPIRDILADLVTFVVERDY
ncbi:MAG: polyprenyl synthetase family protein [Azospirillaceae bacterium]